jgi:serine/threonine-protein kinase RsbW
MSLRLAARPSSVPEGRNWVMEVLRRLPEGFEENSASHRVVELLTSELLTNAVTHGPDNGVVVVRASCTENEVRVEVRDESLELPIAQRADPEATGGRGVGFVDLLSSDWGVIVEADGKTVWFAVNLERPSLFD